MPSNFAAYRVNDKTVAGPDWVNRVMKNIDARIAHLEGLQDAVGAAVAELRAFGLARIDETLAPAYEEIQGLVNLGVLFTASSASAIAISTGAKTLVIDEGDRAQFAPSSYLIIASDADVNNAMSGLLTSYNRETGELIVNVTSMQGSGTHADWSVTVGAIPVPPVVDAYTQAETDQLLADLVNSAGADLDTLGEAETRIETAESAISSLQSASPGAATTSVAGLVELATEAEYRNGTADKALSSDKVWAAMVEVALTDAATIALDMDAGIDFTVTLTANRVLGNPTNTQVGKKGRIRVVQDGTGSRELSLGSNYETAGGGGLTLSTAAGAEDILYYDCISSTRILLSPVLGVS